MSLNAKKKWLDGIFEEDIQKPSIIICNNYLYCANPKCLYKHNDDFASRMCLYQHYKHFRDINFIKNEEIKALDKEIMKYENSGYDVDVR
jgi:hypothetical protein